MVFARTFSWHSRSDSKFHLCVNSLERQKVWNLSTTSPTNLGPLDDCPHYWSVYKDFLCSLMIRKCSHLFGVICWDIQHTLSTLNMIFHSFICSLTGTSDAWMDTPADKVRLCFWTKWWLMQPLHASVIWTNFLASRRALIISYDNKNMGVRTCTWLMWQSTQ